MFQPDSLRRGHARHLGGLLPRPQSGRRKRFLGAGFGRRPAIVPKLLTQAGVERIIYLGGLGDPQADLSPHLRSRQQTGDALREAGVPVTEFQAAVIVGSGSLSFEMIRYLTDRLPVMICPKWVFTKIQPIAIRNVLDYLVAALTCPESTGTNPRNWRKRCGDLCGDDEGVRAGPGTEATVACRAGPDAAPLLLLGTSGHTDSGQYRSTPD
jgi:hypothetical protein